MSKAFFAEFWNVMEDILLNKNTIKNAILQEKENNTKKNKKQKKGMKRKKPSWSVVAIQRLAGLMANFYLYDINLTWPFSDIFSDGINARTWKVFLPPINIQSSYLN